jgi:hypothetical protein
LQDHTKTCWNLTSNTYKVPKKTAWAEEKQNLQGFQNLAGSHKNLLELDQQYLQGSEKNRLG